MQLFSLLGSSDLKAARKQVDEIDPRRRFHEPFAHARTEIDAFLARKCGKW